MGKEIEISIIGPLPGLNEYTLLNRANKYGGNQFKRRTERWISDFIRGQAKGTSFDGPVTIDYVWLEPNKKRDKDNIVFAVKFIQDALVRCGVLRNDGWNDIESFTHSFEINKVYPGVVVRIKEI